MRVLGLTCGFSLPTDEFVPDEPLTFGHDAAAVLVDDGVVRFATEEERLDRVKHSNHFPVRAIAAALAAEGISLADVDAVSYYFGEEANDAELDLMYLRNPGVAIEHSRQLIARRLREAFGDELPDSHIRFVGHHDAHAHSGYFGSDFADALVVVMDGTGGDRSISVLSATGADLTLLRSHPTSKSLGRFYSTAIEVLGYSRFDEYKVMGLAPHGDPSTYAELFASLYELRPDGEYDLRLDGLREALLAGGPPPRRAGEPFERPYKDFAAALQAAFEDIAFHLVRYHQRETGHARLCLSGGAALNSTFNGRLLSSALFERIYVDPSPHDAGAALGAAWATARECGGRVGRRPIRHMYLGRSIGREPGGVETRLRRWETVVDVQPLDAPARNAAALLADGSILGWMQGASEFGPRALGNRSILADPRPAENCSRINQAVKRREWYRPFAPAVLAEYVHDYFVVPDGSDHRFMGFVALVRPEMRDRLGAVTHVDGTARLQVVHRDDNPRFWEVIRGFGESTGVPVLLNTSLNNFAEPIVDSIDDGVACFLTTALDGLVVGNFLVRRRDIDAAAAVRSLVPRLATGAEVVTTVTGGGRPSRAVTMRRGRRRGVPVPVSEEVHELLARADGAATVGDLGGTADAAFADELLALWSSRYVSLGPD